MIAKRHRDLVVIGTGEAGQTAAVIAKKAGMEVAIIDQRPFGGTCALRGCNPKRVLAGAAETLARAQALQGKGIQGSCHLDWKTLMHFQRTLVEGIPGRTEASYRELGLEPFHGHCELTGPRTAQVGEQLLQFDHMVIGAGARPRPLGIEGEELMTTSDQFLELDELPESILFVGAGYISFELAHITARAGAKVQMVETLPTAMTGFDPDLVNMLLEASRRIGIEIYVNTRVTRLVRDKEQVQVYIGEEETPRFRVGMVVHGAGRVPALEGLGLERAEVRMSHGRVRVNEYLQSVSNSAIYVAGDALGQGPQLTPVAEMEGRVAGRNIVEGNRCVPEYDAIPSVAFTMPPIARVGLLEKEARDRGLDIQVLFQDTSGRHITRRHGLAHSGLKVIVENGSGKLVGVHLLGHNVDEVINFFALALAKKHTLEDLSGLITTFPSVTYDVLLRI